MIWIRLMTEMRNMDENDEESDDEINDEEDFDYFNLQIFRL